MIGLGVGVPGFGRAPTPLEAALALSTQPTLWEAPETISETSSAVTGWSGYQGASIGFTQGTGANRPAYISSEPTLNGHPCVHIDTAVKFLEEETTTGALGVLTDASIYVVANLPNPGYFTWHFPLITADSNAQIYPASHNGSGVRELGILDGTHRVATTTSFGAHLWSFLFDATAGECLVRIDGADFVTLLYDGTIFNASSKVQVGVNGGVHAPGGKYGEIMVVSSLDDATAVAVREAYLLGKFDL